MKAKFSIMFLIIFSLSIMAQTVYVTRTGAKYHSAGCRYLRSSSIPMELSDALKKYSACSVCKPPTEVTKKEAIKKENTKTETKKIETTSSTETYNGRTVYTGPRGGKYYINKNGNKTYLKKK